MTYELTVETTFDAGHRLLGYPGKCASPHGHTYRVEMRLAQDATDGIGMVMDFADLKNVLNQWLSENWDHAFLLSSDDAQLVAALAQAPECRTYLFQHENPTVENLAGALFRAMRTAVGPTVKAVKIWETARQSATYSD